MNLDDEGVDLDQLDGLTRIIRHFKKSAAKIDNKTQYGNMKDYFNCLIITCQEFQLKDIKRGLTSGGLRCRDCGKKIELYTDKDLGILAEGKDPNDPDNELKRSIPDELRADHKEEGYAELE